MATRPNVTLLINGQLHSLAPEPDITLLTYLRSTGVNLKGTKLGCGEGGCGACTVVASYFNKALGVISHRAINACLMPLCAADGFAITTIEGLKQTATLHPIQDRIAKGNGTQCGFCTPGIIMALYAFLLENPTASERQLEACLDGNLCRCTGYRPIVEVARSFAHKKPCASNCPNADIETMAAPVVPAAFLKEERPQLMVQGAQYTWHAPLTLAQLLELKKTYPDSDMVVGNTEVEITAHFKGTRAAHIITPSKVEELNFFKESEEGVFVGGALSLTDLQIKLEELVHRLDKTKTRTFTSLLHQLERFAGQQVRNVACLAGNLVAASPTSDLNPVLLAAGAVVHLQSLEGSRTVNLNDWFISYKKVAIKPNEVIVRIFIPYTKPTEFVSAFKQSRRMHDDIAIVTSCFRVLLKEDSSTNPTTTAVSEPLVSKWESASFSRKAAAVPADQGFTGQLPVVPTPPKRWIVDSCSLAFGAMDSRTRLAVNAGKFLEGKAWDFSILQDFVAELAKDFNLPPKVPGGMPEYRRTMARSLFFKFFVDVYAQIYGEAAIPPKFVSAAKKSFDRQRMNSVIDFDVKNPSCEFDVVGTAVNHIAAAKQCTGDAFFASDVDTLFHAVFIQSSKAHAKIVNIDVSNALAVPGVIRIFTHKDVPGKNAYEEGEEVFASSEVPCVGFPIGLLVATSHEIARKAVRLVQVQYEELPAILTLEDAIKQNSTLGDPIALKDGDLEVGFKSADNIMEGEMTVGGQEHFYLETNCAVATRFEDEMEMFCSTQNPSKVQGDVAVALGLAAHAVTVKCKRCGGGFGGKETRNCFVSCAAAVASWHLKKPVKLWLDRDVDQSITGTRHPFHSRYRVGFMNTGRIVAADIQLYANSGYSLDLTMPIIARALFHITNAYKIDNIRVTGYPMKTNKPTNTAFRGFGAPQGVILIEHIVSKISRLLNKPANLVRELNFYTENQDTHYGMKIENCHLQDVWNLMLDKSNFKNREREVSAFNATNRYRKRGIHCVPLMFGLAFTHSPFNQAGALVHIYLDGSVLVSHGGCEIGQGLHTKMAQIAASALKVPLELIKIGDTSTDKVPNTSATAASTQSDLNGMAVLNACKILRERLDAFKATLKETEPIPWVKFVNMAYNARVDLCAHGFWGNNIVKFDFAVGKGRPFTYFVFGAACSEVEIDTLTGDHTVIRSDIVMDIGKSLNPAIDIGQIEGAFVQGYGWCTMEELVNFPNGSYYTLGPSTYKIPGIVDIPADFRVYLLRDVENPLAVHSSKGIGEPPLILGTSIYFALADAIASARAEEGIQGYYSLPHPASCEQIRLSCRDAFTDPTPNAGIKGESWVTRETVPPPDDLRRV